VALRGSYRFQFFGTQEVRVDASASLNLWGPPLTGTARVKVYVFELDVEFGGASRNAQPIAWDEFRASFLPAEPCSVILAEGLIRKPPGDDSGTHLGVLNRKWFRLVTDAVIPSSGSPQAAGLRPPSLAIAPMGLATGDLTSVHTVRVTRSGRSAEQDFTFTPVTKRVPSALWGPRTDPANARPDRPAFVEGAVTGFTLTPSVDVEPSPSTELSADAWSYQDSEVGGVFAWEAPSPPAGRTATAQQIGDTIDTPDTAAARSRLLAALSVTAPIDVSALATAR
jgi:hypothetical protein